MANKDELYKKKLKKRKKKSIIPKTETMYGEKLMEVKKGALTKGQESSLKAGLHFATQGRTLKGGTQPKSKNLISPLVKKAKEFKEENIKQYKKLKKKKA